MRPLILFHHLSEKHLRFTGRMYDETGKTYGERIMNKKQTEMAIQSLKERLVELYGHDVELRIFGSVARGGLEGKFHSHM